MKEIIINSKKHGRKIAMVDDADYKSVNQFTWYLCPMHVVRKTVDKFYAIRIVNLGGKNKTIKMNRFILGLEDSSIICDHIDGNTLNNQRHNLRECTISQNQANRGSLVNSSSRYKGVYWDKRAGSWRAQIKKDKKTRYIGRFKNDVNAAKAYNETALKLHGEFARLNVIE